jgi:hypothetical protein
MFRRDWTPLPAAKAYEELVMEQWWTRWSGTADARGFVTVPAFFGRHRVTVDGREMMVELKKAEGSARVTVR